MIVYIKAEGKNIVINLPKDDSWLIYEDSGAIWLGWGGNTKKPHRLSHDTCSVFANLPEAVSLSRGLGIGSLALNDENLDERMNYLRSQYNKQVKKENYHGN